MSGLMLAMLLAMLDNMIMAPALPTIVGELGGLEHLAWVTTAYILGTTVATPLWGKFGDLFDAQARLHDLDRHLPDRLRAVRDVAEHDGADRLPRAAGHRRRRPDGRRHGGPAVLVPPRDRGRYTGYFMAIMPVSMIGGPLIGGLITDNASWRWAFYVNVPLGVDRAVRRRRDDAPAGRTRDRAGIDWLGAGLMTIWITALVLLTTWGGTQYAWTSPHDPLPDRADLRRRSWPSSWSRCASAEPILPLRVFRNLNFTLAAALSFVVGFAMFGAMTFLPQFQQYVQGASATASGLLLLPMMVGVSSPASPPGSSSPAPGATGLPDRRDRPASASAWRCWRP